MQNKLETFLITGGAGTIGAIVVEMLLENKEINEVVVVDLSENSIALLQERLRFKEKVTYYVGDVNDHLLLGYIFKKHHINYVIHCAAHKHLPLMQKQLYALVKNNVQGLVNIASYSEKFNVRKFLFLSTDKAVHPTSFMGITKRVGELYVAQMNKKSNNHFYSIRFGNVLDSQGSVLKKFEEQWKQFKKVFITHRDVKRFFITKKEAGEYIIKGMQVNNCDLILGNYTNEVKIEELGREFLFNKGVLHPENVIEYSGLYDGEKLSESLSYDYEEFKDAKICNISFLPQIQSSNSALLKNLDQLIKMNSLGQEKRVRILLENIL